MTFGLTGEPKTFSCLGNDLCREFLDEFVIIYIDDLLIYNKTLEEYMLRIELNSLSIRFHTSAWSYQASNVNTRKGTCPRLVST